MDRPLAVRAIRPYEARDLSALYAICLRTGAAGQDATTMLDDPTLLGEVFAAPYGVLEPEHAFVLADDDRVLGYALGAVDTREFEARCATEWWPSAQARHPVSAGGRRLDDLLVAMIHEPLAADDTTVARYPSHLHIDLLPEAQAAGWGRRRMMDALFARLAEDGSTGVHWGVSRANESALGFYRHLGATPIAEDPMTHRFGWPL